ncbi:unnamed protein product [Hermetia illucens]|uniref:Uncharacterized protein n=1 Tax=Hermetia illucens TaxID=343691 RepID=A0A7R8UNH6_HERIL|nr:unnamed protein product [Hermetia illucens]
MDYYQKIQKAYLQLTSEDKLTFCNPQIPETPERGNLRIDHNLPYRSLTRLETFLQHKIKAVERYFTQLEQLHYSIWSAANGSDALSTYDADNYLIIVVQGQDSSLR